MYNNAKRHDPHYVDELDGSDAALIDSYFLPGGILDPEESQHNGSNISDRLVSNDDLDDDTNGRARTKDFKKEEYCLSSSQRLPPSIRSTEAIFPISRNGVTKSITTSGIDGQYILGSEEPLPVPNSHHYGKNYLNNDRLRSQLEELAVGSRALNSNTNKKPTSLPIGSDLTPSSPHHLDARGFAALDPLVDYNVVGIGGRPILMNASPPGTHGLPASTVEHSQSARMIDPSNICKTNVGLNSSTASPPDTNAATATTNRTIMAGTRTRLGDYSSDWFTPSSIMATSSRQHHVKDDGNEEEEFSRFLQGALPMREQDLITFGSSSLVHDVSLYPSLPQQDPFQGRSSLGSSVNQEGSRISSAASVPSIRRNPWNMQNGAHDKVTQFQSSSSNSASSPRLVYDAAVPNDRAKSRASSGTNICATTVLPTLDTKTSIFAPTGAERVRAPPGFLSSSSPPPVTSTVTGKSTGDTFQKEELAHVNTVRKEGTIVQGRVSERTQDLRIPVVSNDRDMDDFGECNINGMAAARDIPSPCVHHHQQQRHHRPQEEEIPKGREENDIPSPHHNDGDYEVSSLNTKMSRDVPSTIYVEEDAISTSEDTLTVCADSVTEASIPRSHGKVLDHDRNGMDAVQETDAIEKRNKSKRSKKKRTKKKHQLQDSVESVESFHPDPSNLDNDALRVGHRSDTEEESKETRKAIKVQTRSNAKKDQPSVVKAQANSRSSGTTTEPSSTAETILHSPVKKDTLSKSRNEKHHKRTTERKTQTTSLKPREPWLEIISKWIAEVFPIILGFLHSLVPVMNSTIRSVTDTCKAWIPKKEKFWFLFPICCVSLDLFFLSSAVICKSCGQLVYLFVMTHKLALMELVENDHTAVCYSLIFFYPMIMKTIRTTTNYHHYWYIFARWVAIDRFFCRPITLKDTYLYNIKKKADRNKSAMGVMKNSLIKGNRFLPSLKAAVDHVIKVSKEEEKTEESERLKMANHILLILRRATPFIMLLESHIHRDGFLILMTNTERILFGYGLAVLRSGYLFSPLIWISWTVQLTIIMFVDANTAWSYFTLILGLVSIRLSHYSAAVEDLDGTDAVNSHATSKRRRMAAYPHYHD